MGVITVRFFGICTHVSQRRWPPGMGWGLPVPHRVILPQNPGTLMFDPIPRHFPILKGIDGEKAYGDLLVKTVNDEYRIQRAILRIPSVKEGITYDATWARIPKMSDPPRPARIDPDPEVLLGKRVHAFFDITAGTFSSCCNKRAAVAVVKIEVDDSPKLVVQSISDPSESYDVELSKPELSVQHTSGQTAHDDKHFALHFAIARSVLPTDDLTNTLECVGNSCDNRIELGPGCSNTDYP